MKKRLFLLSLVSLVFPVVSAIAHHSYAEYDRNKAVTLEGAISKVLWANPHVLITLHTENQGDYSIEWGAVSQLTRQGMNVAALKSGDRVVVTGSVNRNPEKHILTLVREIRRPADGWLWTRPF
jgi:uncharacterized protein DUF6152